jgi:hypothetical protein
MKERASALPDKERKSLQYDNPFTNRSIIWIKPLKAMIVDNWE